MLWLTIVDMLHAITTVYEDVPMHIMRPCQCNTYNSCYSLIRGYFIKIQVRLRGFHYHSSTMLWITVIEKVLSSLI